MSNKTDWEYPNYGGNAAAGVAVGGSGGQWPPAPPPKIERKPLVEELREQRDAASKEYATHSFATTRLGKLIDDLDKAIAALEPQSALLDPQPEAASPEFASEQGAALEEMIATSDAVCEELSEAYTPLQIPEGFTPWSGGECPVPGQSVEYLCAADDVPVKTDRPEDWTWRHEGIPSRARIIAYRIIQPSAEAERIEDVSEPLATIELSEGFIPWSGGECPVDGSTLVNVKLASGIYGRHQMNRYANSLNWAHGDGFDSIVAYRIITDVERTSEESQATDQDRVELKQTESSSQASSTEAGEIPEGFTAWGGGEAPSLGLLDVMFRWDPAIHVGSGAHLKWNHTGGCADIVAYRIVDENWRMTSGGEPSAEAERTEVDSSPTEQDRVEPGIQFRVDGGPLQTTGQEPAAFAPVNAIEEPETDALMWANGFEADAKSKAETEQDKRPFWTRAPKPKVNA